MTNEPSFKNCMCQNRGGGIINWRTVNDTNFNLPQILGETEQLKAGSLFECSICKQAWFLDKNRSVMYFVPDYKMPLIEKWNAGPQTISTESLKILNKIGAISYNDFFGSFRSLNIPCKVTTIKNEIIDKAIISIQDFPPLDSMQKHIRFASEISQISRSEYALPYRLRIKTTKVRERRMAYYPSPVKARFWQRFNLNGPTNFIDFRGIKGKNIRSSFFFSENSITLGDNSDQITYFITDLNAEIMSTFGL